MICLSFIACKKSEAEQAEPVVETVTVDTEVDSAIVNQDEPAQIVAPSEDKKETGTVSKPAPIKANTTDANIEYASFGDKFQPKQVMTSEQMMAKYATLKKGDTLDVRFASTIKEVCKKKGCWMSMQLPNGKESFVRFKDYGFFVPLNAAKSDAIIKGKAFLDVVSVDDQRHYAKDGGKSDAEIAMITQPKITYAFTADGVLIKP